MGAEFEGRYTHGPIGITVGATYTDAKIDSDPVSPALVGNTPRHQPKLIFQATPQFQVEKFTIGANLVGTTSSFAQDTNQRKMPGFTVVNAFVQFGPMKRVQLSVTGGHLFNAKGYTEISAPTIPANGVTTGRAINGRTAIAALTFTL